MKTKLFTVFLVCFFANLYTSQTIIQTADLKITKIATILKDKGYDIVEQSETYLKIKNNEGSMVFIDLDPAKKYLYFNIKVLLKKDTPKAKIDQLVHDINDLNMIKVKYIAEDNSIFFQYFYWITNSFTLESFEDAIVEFFLYQGDTFNIDKEKIFNYD